MCTLLGAGTRIALEPEPILGISEFESARVDDGDRQVTVTLTAQGAAVLARVSRENIGRRLAVVVNDTVVAMPVISAEITTGTLRLMPQTSNRAARNFARRINAAIRRSQSVRAPRRSLPSAFSAAVPTPRESS